MDSQGSCTQNCCALFEVSICDIPPHCDHLSLEVTHFEVFLQAQRCIKRIHLYVCNRLNLQKFIVSSLFILVKTGCIVELYLSPFIAVPCLIRMSGRINVGISQRSIFFHPWFDFSLKCRHLASNLCSDLTLDYMKQITVVSFINRVDFKPFAISFKFVNMATCWSAGYWSISIIASSTLIGCCTEFQLLLSPGGALYSLNVVTVISIHTIFFKIAKQPFFKGDIVICRLLKLCSLNENDISLNLWNLALQRTKCGWSAPIQSFQRDELCV